MYIVTGFKLGDYFSPLKIHYLNAMQYFCFFVVIKKFTKLKRVEGLSSCTSVAAVPFQWYDWLYNN